mgnify:CR=1 FL=1
MYTSPEDQDRNGSGVGSGVDNGSNGSNGSGGRALPAARLGHDQIVWVFGGKPVDPTPALPAEGSRPARTAGLELARDLSCDIGSRRWFAGLGTFVALTAVALAFWPGYAPLEAAPPTRIETTNIDEYRSHMIMPLALGSDTGRRMGATALVRPLAAAPERPQLELVATLARGDSFDRTLLRAGVGREDAARVAALVSDAMAIDEIEPGTKIDITLGRRSSAEAPRPLDHLQFRARFDLELALTRPGPGSALSLERKVIRVDDTPLRIRGRVGSSLYRSARAAGAPASAVQAYLKALGDHVDMDREIAADDTFDLIVAHRRAATGERQAGQLLFAGLESGDKPRAQLMRWGEKGAFFEASGVGEQRSGLVAPVPGPMSSSYGMRRHPILGYRRMHSGVDFRARHDTPIVAVTDGRVTGAGRMGGCGNAVRLRHGGGLDTRYCHMSRIAVQNGQSVRRGQVIGYVGSTGLSTGPHLHYEMFRGGRSINPAGVSFVTRAQLSGSELREFRATLARLKTVEAGAALAELDQTEAESAAREPQREIDRLDPQRAQPTT